MHHFPPPTCSRKRKPRWLSLLLTALVVLPTHVLYAQKSNDYSGYRPASAPSSGQFDGGSFYPATPNPRYDSPQPEQRQPYPTPMSNYPGANAAGPNAPPGANNVNPNTDYSDAGNADNSLGYDSGAGGDSGPGSGSGLIINPKKQPSYNGKLAKEKTVSLNFVGAGIDALARAMSAITGKNVVVDPRVKGTITLQTQDPITPTKAYSLFTSALRLQGYAVVSNDGVEKIIPDTDARLQVSPVEVSGVKEKLGGNQIITKVFHLQYISASFLQTVVRPLLSPNNNTMSVNPTTNAIIVTDYGDNIKRITQIITALDAPMATDVVVIPLKYAAATDLAPLVSKLADGSGNQPSMVDGSYKTTVLADARSNSLIIRSANQARLEQVKRIIKSLDRKPEDNGNGASGNIYVVHLKNADAAQLATTLRAALSADDAMSSQANSMSAGGMGMGGGGSGGGGFMGPPGGSSRSMNASPMAGVASSPGGGNSSSNGFSGSMPGMPELGANRGAGQATGGQIQADTATNSLIITCSEPQYRQLRAVIDRLDAPRPQVFVESLIAEVNEDKASQFGIQWQGPVGNTGGSNIGFMGTNFGTQGNIINLSGAINNPSMFANGATNPGIGQGLNFGFAHKFGGVYVLGALANFLEQTGAGNVLSTPNLLTLDNTMASIMVGQEVPFITGSTFNTTGGSNNTAFNTVERKNVGLQLKILPRISQDGMINMQIYQEVSDIDSTTKSNPNGPTTNKRSLQTDVLVKDGAIVVLGGLLQDQYSRNRSRVPGLGDIPILGALFGTESRVLSKRNLMIFLRPVIIWDHNQNGKFAEDKYDEMRSLQQDTQPSYSKTQPITNVPVLPKYKNQSLGNPNAASPSDMGSLETTSSNPLPTQNKVLYLHQSKTEVPLKDHLGQASAAKPGMLPDEPLSKSSIQKEGRALLKGAQFQTPAPTHGVVDGNQKPVQLGIAQADAAQTKQPS